MSVAGTPEIAQNSAIHKVIASAFKDATIYTSEPAIIKVPTPAILPPGRPAQQQAQPKEAKEQTEAIAMSPTRTGAKLVMEPAERIPTWAEHTVKWNPINTALTPPEANQFDWKASSDTIQSYRHIETGRHIHIDGPSGRFYDQDRKPITKAEALAHAMPGDRVHSQDKPSLELGQTKASPSTPALDKISPGISM